MSDPLELINRRRWHRHRGPVLEREGMGVRIHLPDEPLTVEEALQLAHDLRLWAKSMGHG